MRVSLSNGSVEIIEKRGLRTKSRFEHFKGLMLRGYTQEEQAASFDYSRIAGNDKDLRKKLRDKQRDGFIKLKFFSVEQVLGLDGIPPGYSTLVK